MEGLAYIKFSMYLQFSTVQNNILKNLLHINCFRADIFWGAGVAHCDWSTGYTEKFCFDTRQGQEIFSLLKRPYWLWDLCRQLLNGYIGPFSWRYGSGSVQPIYHLHLVLRLRMRAAVSTPPDKPHSSSGMKFHHSDCPLSYERRRTSAWTMPLWVQNPESHPAKICPPGK
jgi:hypothetical protein